MSFNGKSYLRTNFSNDLRWHPGPFTIEFVIYPTSYAGWATNLGNGTILGNVRHESTTNYYTFGIENKQLLFYYYNGSPNRVYSTSLIPLASWTHVALVSYNNNISIYINGSLETTVAVLGTPQFSTAIEFSIGMASSTAINGYIDSIRLTKRALLPDDFLISHTA